MRSPSIFWSESIIYSSFFVSGKAAAAAQNRDHVSPYRKKSLRGRKLPTKLKRSKPRPCLHSVEGSPQIIVISFPGSSVEWQADSLNPNKPHVHQS